METANSPKSLREILNVSKTPRTAQPEPAHTNLLATIKPIFRLLAQIEKVTEATLSEKLAGLRSPDASNKALHLGIQTLSTLSIRSQDAGKPEPWETAAQAEILKDLREKVVGRVLVRNRRGFELSRAEENEALIRALIPFRKASKGVELNLCSREGMAPGSGKLAKASHIRTKADQTPEAIEEILYCLAQISIGVRKTNAPILTALEAAALQKTAILLQNPKNKKPALPAETTARLEVFSDPKTARASAIETVANIIKSLQPDPASLALLEREIELFDSNLGDIGTEIEMVDGLHKVEFQTVKTLETLYVRLDSVRVPERFERPENLEATKLQIFQGLREISPALGKATTLVLTEKLALDEEWLPSFLENGHDAIYQAKAFRNLIVLTEPENSLFGGPVDPDRYLQEGETLRDALALVNRAEGSIYSDPVLSSLNQSDREDILFAAQRVCSETIPDEELEKRKLLKDLSKMKEKAEAMAKAITREVEGSESSLETLPAALREKEQQEKVATSLTRSIQILSTPEASAAMDALLLEEQALLKTLEENPAPDENDRKAAAHCQEKIATLQALKDFSTSPELLEDKNYDILMTTLAQTTVPRTLREHALISLCDNKSADGTKIKTKEILDRMQLLSGIPHLTNRIRGDLGTLRRWKDKETAPRTLKKKDLAFSICRTPENLKQTIRKDLKHALKSCLVANPWKNPANTTAKELGDCNSAYLLAKKEYAGHQATFLRLRALHARTADLQKASGNSVWVRAQKIAEDLRSNDTGSLKALEDLALEAILSSPNPKAGIDYMTAWYTSIGNEYTLQKESISTNEDRPHFDPIPLVAARIQTKIENLLEIGSYLKAVSQTPEALAETYIQQRNHEKHGKKEEAWETRITRMMAKNSKGIEDSKAELEDWKSKFNAIFDEDPDEGYTQEETERRESMKSVCQRKIAQKERELESLYLKQERLAELQTTSAAINRVTKPEEVADALRSQNRRELNSMDDALEQAFALASSPTKLNLPQNIKKETTTFQMLEGAAVQTAINQIRNTLKEAATILKIQNPEVAEIELDTENPQDIARKLKQAAFKTLKEVEMHLWESGKSMDLSFDEQESFLRENPELIESRKEWIATLLKTEAGIAPAAELADTLPQKKKGKAKEQMATAIV